MKDLTKAIEQLRIAQDLVVQAIDQIKSQSNQDILSFDAGVKKVTNISKLTSKKKKRIQAIIEEICSKENVGVYRLLESGNKTGDVLTARRKITQKCVRQGGYTKECVAQALNVKISTITNDLHEAGKRRYGNEEISNSDENP